MKVRQQRSLGLSGWRKIVGQVIVAVPSASWR
jgi:phospho-N-acetylmuramoyl-pentapeptide-transferase